MEHLWKSCRFVYQILIAPWPIFSVFLALSALIGGIIPLLHIKITAGLVDSLTSNLHTQLPSKNSSLITILAPYVPWLLLVFAVMLVNWIIYMDTFQRYLAAQLNERVQQNFDKMFYHKVLRMRLEYLENASYYDTLQRALRTMEGNAVSYQLAQLQRLLSTSCSLIGILYALFAAHWTLPVILLVGTFFLLKRHVQNGLHLTEVIASLDPMQRRRSYLANLLTERQSAAEIRLYRLANYLITRWRELSDKRMNALSEVRRRNMIKGLPILAVTNSIQATILFALILLGYEGKLSAGNLIALLFAVQQYLGRIHNISWRIEGLYGFFSNLRYLQQFLSMEGEETSTGIKLPILEKKEIKFDGVGFSYPGSDKSVVSDISFTIRPGEKIALVGENGAGKTTIAKLLLGLYQPATGKILINQTDLKSIDPRSWRDKTGAVFQDFVRYSLTIRENIGFGRLNKMNDLAEIEKAAKSSSVYDTIRNMPDKYETILGKEFEGGQELSGGQWQKLAIARAYLRDAEIVVLDEPAAALDALSEMEVYRNFLQLSEGKTVLLISHRLGSARLADRILFIEKGRLMEEGTHEQLLKNGGKYAQLYRLQAEWYRTEMAGDGREQT